MESYDLIIIGTGAGGGTLAYALADSGMRILLIERGDYLPQEPQNWQPRVVFDERRYKPDETWYGQDGKPFHPGVHYFVGGNTKVYGAALPRLRREDFGALEHEGGTSPAWPITYDELEPYYNRAEAIYRVHGEPGEDPTEPPRSCPFPFPAVDTRAGHRRAGVTPARQWAASVPPADGHRPARGRAVHPLQDLRRLPLPGAGQERGRRLLRAPGAGEPRRHAVDTHQGAAPAHRPHRQAGHRRRGGEGRRQADGDAPHATWSPAAPSTRRCCCCARPTAPTPTGSPTAAGWSAATTWCTTTRR